MTGARPLLPASLQDHPTQEQQYQPHSQQHARSQDSGELPLAPATGAGRAAGGGGAAASSGPPGKPQYSKRGKITIVACVPCRRRKTKCDGKRPVCSQCSSRDSQCQYDMTDDQRKLTFLRDNVEHLQEKSSNLEGLLHTVQTANDEEAAEIFRRLRSGTDVQHVAEQVHAGQLLSGVSRRDSELDLQQQSTDHGQARARQYDLLMQHLASSGHNDTNDVLHRIRNGEDVAAILDAINSGNLSPLRLIRNGPTHTIATLESDFSGQEQTFGIIKGAPMANTHAASGMGIEFTVSQMKQPWTDVTDNEELVDYLLTLYFTWQHSFFQSFPEDLFRSDYEHRRTKYCSAMLVNAICAAGCFLADTDKLTELDSDSAQLAERFYKSATKLLEKIQGSSITTTAALYLISYFEGTRGLLSNLWMYSGRSSLMAVDLNLHLKRADIEGVSADEQQERQNERRARCHAFWGAFHVDQLTSFTLGRLPNLNSHGVTQESPPVNEEEDNIPWSAPEVEALPRRPGAKASTFSYCASLSRIVNGTLLMFFAPLVPLSGSLLIDEYQKYQDWYHGLPAKLNNTNDAPPHVLCLHMYYWAAVLHLFRPFLKATVNNSDVVPRDVCRLAANSLSELMMEHKRIYQLRGIYMFQVHCLLAACTIHIINVPSIQATRYFTEACDTFQTLIPGHEWARSCLKVLRRLVEKWSLIIPLEAEEALCRDQYSERSNVPQSSSSNDLPRLQHATDPSSIFSEVTSSEHEHIGRPGPYPKQHPGQGRGRPPGQNLTKRSSSSGGSSLNLANLPAPGPQKRQRIMAPSPAGGASETIIPAARPDRDKSPPHSQTPESFLYSPLVGQAAPMLTPVQTGNTVTTLQADARARRRLPTGRPPPVPRPAAETPADVANMTIPATSHERKLAPSARGVLQQSASSDVASSAAANAVRPGPTSLLATADSDTMANVKAEAGRAHDATGESAAAQHGVEGLSFGDDWRDPFMGFLGQGFHEE